MNIDVPCDGEELFHLRNRIGTILQETLNNATDKYNWFIDCIDGNKISFEIKYNYSVVHWNEQLEKFSLRNMREMLYFLSMKFLYRFNIEALRAGIRYLDEKIHPASNLIDAVSNDLDKTNEKLVSALSDIAKLDEQISVLKMNIMEIENRLQKNKYL